MDIIEALIEKSEALIQKMEERDAMYARALQKRQKAEIPEEELHKIRETIEKTNCNMPDTAEMEKKIITGVTGGICSVLSDEIQEAIKNEYVPSECVETLKKKLNVYRAICVLIGLMCMGALLWYHHSEHFWGSQYLDVVQSRFTSEDEKKVLWKDTYAVDALPKEYETNPAYVKAKIKQNKAVLKERELQAKANNGKWSKTIPIER